VSRETHLEKSEPAAEKEYVNGGPGLERLHKEPTNVAKDPRMTRKKKTTKLKKICFREIRRKKKTKKETNTPKN